MRNENQTNENSQKQQQQENPSIGQQSDGLHNNQAKQQARSLGSEDNETNQADNSNQFKSSKPRY